MKQKYFILKNTEKNELIIREFAELDKESFSLLCEETFQKDQITSAIAKGKEALVATIRTKNMYPIGPFAAKIAEEVTNLYESKDKDSIELAFDDIDILTKERVAHKPLDDIESEPVEIDELLVEDVAPAFDDSEIDNISYPIQIADDDAVNTDDEE
ncbi:MAG: hypothetical protein ABIK98_13565 [Pseudomonadota bacterium]|uniref:Uncharacterized protein n=1 Tax=Candidatus Desulfatibia profunda TaxID=2841695 RepID=A0A8J6TNB1_9BACT|nr:hypothetical protein [Candidatus Desulfatibia profunda]MBL7181270.1 hypothetical protein [Desulfobacterales bacterium]